MSLPTIQANIAALLETVTALAGIEIMCELDELATAAELDEQDAIFEREIAERGFVVLISAPRVEKIDGVLGKSTAGAAHLRLLCQVAFIENPAVNRAGVDPAQPTLRPANLRPLVVIRAIMQAALGAGYDLPAQPLAAPVADLEGLNLHGLIITGRDDVRAA